MWELGHKEGWVLKNWCFWIVALEKMLESPLDCKDIKPVNPKGNKLWIFIGWTDAEAPIFWPPDAKSRLIGKYPDAEECSNYHTIVLISYSSKIMFKILQARLQYVNWELPDIQVGFRKGRGTRDQIANILCIIDKPRKFQKNIYFYLTDYAKAFDCVDHNKLWKILKEMGIPDHLTCLLRNLYAGQEATVRTGHGTTNWFKIGKRVSQDCILPLCLFNFYADYIMQNAGLDESQAGTKISGRNINNLR